ncbi:hypothetical protein V6N12_050405 [Hibiscus sabdariffa]|uniref:Uncharacterized protein n=1 Tax=Hibiscus sabdariffa TaxID=183260 RepID=A0ABR2GCB4_9ROSI
MDSVAGQGVSSIGVKNLEFFSPYRLESDVISRGPKELAQPGNDNNGFYDPWMVANSQCKMEKGWMAAGKVDAIETMGTSSRFDVL